MFFVVDDEDDGLHGKEGVKVREKGRGWQVEWWEN